MNELSILIVEDNPSDADLIEEYLAEDYRQNYSISKVETLESALKLLARKNIDVVLLDLSLPDSSGLDTLRTLLTSYPQMVLVVLTGLKDQQVALQAVRFGAQDYLEKDQLTPSLLQRSIAYAVERKKAALEKMLLFADLGKALDQLQALQGILPFCASCKKIQDANGRWQPIEMFIKNYSARDVSQNICPDCRKELYTDLDRP